MIYSYIHTHIHWRSYAHTHTRAHTLPKIFHYNRAKLVWSCFRSTTTVELIKCFNIDNKFHTSLLIRNRPYSKCEIQYHESINHGAGWLYLHYCLRCLLELNRLLLCARTLFLWKKKKLQLYKVKDTNFCFDPIFHFVCFFFLLLASLLISFCLFFISSFFGFAVWLLCCSYYGFFPLFFFFSSYFNSSLPTSSFHSKFRSSP